MTYSINIFHIVLNKTYDLVHSLEGKATPLINYGITFFCIISLRNLIEITSTKVRVPILPAAFIHYYLFYVFIFLLIIVVFHFVTKEDINKVLKVAVPFSGIIIIAPLLDLIISGGKGYAMTYFYPEKQNLLLSYFTFGGIVPRISGVSMGIRIEVAIMLVLSFLYFRVKRLPAVKSIFSVILVYTILFFASMTPYLLQKVYGFFSVDYLFDRSDIMNFYLLGIGFLILLFLWIKDPYKIKVLVKDIRPFRLIHYEFMLVIGVLIYSRDLGFLGDWSSLCSLILLFASVFFAGIYSKVINDIEDEGIDKITNPGRPLPSGSISVNEYKKIGYFSLILSLVYAYSVNSLIMLLIVCGMANYYMYSAFPLKLKRVPVFSKLIISINSVILIVVGYVFAGGSIYSFPLVILFFFLIFFTVCANVIDIKDAEGDKAFGIRTLPVVLGVEKAKLIIGIAFILTYSALIFIAKNIIWVVPLIGAGLLQFYYVTRKDYNEKYIFIFYILSLAYISCFINFKV